MNRILKSLVVVAILASPALAVNRQFAGSDANAQIYITPNENINFVDYSTGPITLSSLANPTHLSSATASGFIGFYSQTSAQINASTPTAKGQAFFCNNCAVGVCISTGTTKGSYSVITATSTACQ